MERGAERGATTATAEPQAELRALTSIREQSCRLDAARVTAALDLVRAHGEILLTGKGYRSPGELPTRADRERWRAAAKGLAAKEIHHDHGCSLQEARDLVALATGPSEVQVPAVEAMLRAWVPWRLVRRFWILCRDLPVEAAEAVAEAMFGSDPALAAVERLGPDGELTDRPWYHGEFSAALDREVLRYRAEDVESERARRRAAYDSRGAQVTVHDDGTSTLELRHDTLAVAALGQRLERLARAARSGGDERTLHQLRADGAVALLANGVLPEPEEPDEQEAGTAPAGAGGAAADDLHRIVNALPAVQVGVVVPLDALCGEAAPDAPYRGVGRILGLPGSASISAGHARELLLRPGTTLHRLVTDPCDGRLVERTLGSYRPDADMRRQIIAADLRSRYPGSRVPAERCELDHVTPWRSDGSGGGTAETNLVALHKGGHQDKTDRNLLTAINDRRDLVFTTPLGQVITTRVHDYRELDDPAVRQRCSSGMVPPGDPPPRSGESHRERLNLQLCRALAARGPDEVLALAEDDPNHVEHHPHPYRSWWRVPERPDLPSGGRRGRGRRGSPGDRLTPRDGPGIGSPSETGPRSETRPSSDDLPPF